MAARLPNPAVQRTKKLIRINRLRNVIVHARFKTPISISRHGIGGHGNNGQLIETRVSPDNPGCFEFHP